MKMIRCDRIAIALAFALAAATAWAARDEFPAEREQNWHQWRGPLANGVAPLADPPTEWDENTNIKWKVKIPGDSTATPIVWGDQIFLITAVKTDREIECRPSGRRRPPRATLRHSSSRNNYYQFVVMCVDRKTGKTLWQHVAKEEVPHEGHHPDGSFASASPMTDGKQLYVSFGSRGVYCYDLEGNQKWSRDLGRMKIIQHVRRRPSPVVHGDSVIVNWDHQGGSFITRSTPRRAKPAGRSTATKEHLGHAAGGRARRPHASRSSTAAKRVRSYDLKTGELIWACGGQTPSAIPCPVSDGKNVYLHDRLHRQLAVCDSARLDRRHHRVRKTEAEKIAWKRNQPGTPYVPSPLLYGELLYFTGRQQGHPVVPERQDRRAGDRSHSGWKASRTSTPRRSAPPTAFTSPAARATRVVDRGSRKGPTASSEDPGDQQARRPVRRLGRRRGQRDLSARQARHLYCISAE